MNKNHLNKIRLFKEQIDVECLPDNSILDATLAANIQHTHACGGQGKCSTCRVSILKGLENCLPKNKAEQEIAKKLNFPQEIRLACQTYLSGNVTIRRMVVDKLDMDLINQQFSLDSDMALGSQQELTIMFTDIANYTTFAESFPPYDIVHVLNRYYKIMNAVIMNHNGIISDVAGDGILSIFGTSNEKGNSVLDAVRSVQDMNESLNIFNDYLRDNYNTSFGIRAGIHYGNVIIGPFDTGKMKKIAVIGDNVNYASRIESANKKYGSKLLLSKDAYTKIKGDYPLKDKYETTLKGKSGKYQLYELQLT